MDATSAALGTTWVNLYFLAFYLLSNMIVAKYFASFCFVRFADQRSLLVAFIIEAFVVQYDRTLKEKKSAPERFPRERFDLERVYHNLFTDSHDEVTLSPTKNLSEPLISNEVL